MPLPKKLVPSFNLEKCVQKKGFWIYGILTTGYNDILVLEIKIKTLCSVWEQIIYKNIPAFHKLGGSRKKCCSIRGTLL